MLIVPMFLHHHSILLLPHFLMVLYTYINLHGNTFTEMYLPGSVLLSPLNDKCRSSVIIKPTYRAFHNVLRDYNHL
jgi:hypothetical protein